MAERTVSRDEFICTIGYDGMTAIVSAQQLKAVKGKSFDQLLAEGNFRTAAACAVYDASEAEMQKLIDVYNAKTGGHYTVKKIGRLFGIMPVHKVKKVLAL